MSRRWWWAEKVLLVTMGLLALTLYLVAWSPDWSAMSESGAVALVAIIAAAIVAAAALVSMVLVSRTDRTQAAELAIRDRRQARLEDAYVELLRFMAAAGAHTDALLPAVDGLPVDPARDAPPLPDAADEWSMTAKVAAFGSNEVQDALQTWRACLDDVRRLVHEVRLREQRGSGHWVEAWAQLDDAARPTEVGARRRLHELVATELDELKPRT